MNNQDRKTVTNAIELITRALEMITEVTDDHQGRLDNMPESLQGSERYEKMENSQGLLDQLRDDLENLESTAQEVLEE